MQGSGQIVFNKDKKEDGVPIVSSQEDYQHALQDLVLDTSKKAAGMEVQKESDKVRIASEQKLESLVKQAPSSVLFKISTIFPFKFFPTTLIIRANKIDIINMLFFASETIHTTMIDDITDVTVETSLFFATMKITDKGYHDQLITIEYLDKSAAMKARRIIQGLIAAKAEKIDPTKIDPNKLVEQAELLGKARDV